MAVLRSSRRTAFRLLKYAESWKERGWGLRVRGRKSNKTGSPFAEENCSSFQSEYLFFVLG
ncbi:hypothetical protein V512_013565 [Mesotoga sp. Brook.08.105.5.1]|nr:hypothetical protein V512_013565 [Mesotoga sp. Brook.08.105.5.1]